MVTVTDRSAVLGCRRGSQLITPLAAAVSLAAIGDVGCRLFLQVRDLVNNLITLEEKHLTALAGFQAEVRMKLLALFVAIDKQTTPSVHLLVGQLPSIGGIGGDTYLIVLQVDALPPRIVQFHPGVRELVQVIHHAVNVRLHQFVDNQRSILTVSISMRRQRRHQ